MKPSISSPSPLFKKANRGDRIGLKSEVIGRHEGDLMIQEPAEHLMTVIIVLLLARK